MARKRLEHFRAGRVPSGRSAAGFFVAIIEHAKAEKDVGLFEDALAGMKKALGGNPRAARFLKRFEGQLAELKGAQEPEDGEDTPDGGKKPF